MGRLAGPDAPSQFQAGFGLFPNRSDQGLKVLLIKRIELLPPDPYRTQPEILRRKRLQLSHKPAARTILLLLAEHTYCLPYGLYRVKTDSWVGIGRLLKQLLERPLSVQANPLWNLGTTDAGKSFPYRGPLQQARSNLLARPG